MITTDVPLQIAGLFSWYKADTIGVGDGSGVATWSDSSGNGRDATQVTGANQPTFRATWRNGRPAVDFDGTNDFMTATGSSGDAFTIFAVIDSRTTTDQYFIHNGNGNGYAMSVHNPGGGAVRDMVYAGVIDNTGGTYVAGTWEIWCATRATGTNGQANLYANGTSVVSTTGTISAPTATVALGAHNAGADNFLSGYISEIIFYTSTLTAQQRAQIHTYLALKYSMTTTDMIPTRTANFSNSRPHPFSPGIAR